MSMQRSWASRGRHWPSPELQPLQISSDTLQAGVQGCVSLTHRFLEHMEAGEECSAKSVEAWREARAAHRRHVIK